MTPEERDMRIKEIDQQIAETRAMLERGSVGPQNLQGVASYVISGDRGMMDKVYDFERQKAMQDAQLANAIKMAAKQREEQEAYNKDQWMLNYQNASSEVSAASAALDAAKKSGNTVDIAVAERNYEKAVNQEEYWKKRLGLTDEQQPKDREVPAASVEDKEEKKTTQDIDSLLAQYSGITSFKTKKEKAAKIAEAKANENWGQGDAGKKLQEQVNTWEKIKTKEEIDAFKAEAKSSYDALPKNAKGEPKPGALAKWKKEHPDYANALGKK